MQCSGENCTVAYGSGGKCYLRKTGTAASPEGGVSSAVEQEQEQEQDQAQEDEDEEEDIMM